MRRVVLRAGICALLLNVVFVPASFAVTTNAYEEADRGRFLQVFLDRLETRRDDWREFLNESRNGSFGSREDRLAWWQERRDYRCGLFASVDCVEEPVVVPPESVAPAVPVPAAVWLFASALGGLAFVRRRRIK